MITREEAIAKIWDNKILTTLSKVFCDDLVKKLFDQQDQLQQHIKSLEAQLANTEQLTCESCDFCGEDCAVLEMLMSQFGFEVENCICPNYTKKDPQ